MTNFLPTNFSSVMTKKKNYQQTFIGDDKYFTNGYSIGNNMTFTYEYVVSKSVTFSLLTIRW